MSVTDWTRGPTSCIGTLDMEQLTYSFVTMGPFYKTRPMTRGGKSISQGSYGQVSEWSYTDAGSSVSVIVKIIDKDRLAQKLWSMGYSKADADSAAEAKFDAALNGLRIADALRTCDLVRSLGFVNDTNTKLVTVMENLTQDASSVFPQTVYVPSATFKPSLLAATSRHTLLALELIEFLDKLLQCLPPGVSYTDMKLANIGYCKLDHRFRLLDIDSFNTRIATWGYLTQGREVPDPDPALATAYAFGITAASVFFDLPRYFDHSRFNPSRCATALKDILVKISADDRFKTMRRLVGNALAVLEERPLVAADSAPAPVPAPALAMVAAPVPAPVAAPVPALHENPFVRAYAVELDKQNRGGGAV